MKKHFLLFALIWSSCLGAYAQILKPITWSYSSKRTSSTEAVIYIKADLEQGWHLYSQTVGEGGPVATSFHFASASSYALLGRTVEPKPVKKFEPVFMMEVSYFENSAIFQQKVKLKSRKPIVSGKVEFMVCNDKQCLPRGEVEFSIPVK